MPVDVTLNDADREALQRWIRRTGIGSTVSDVEPLTGGSQNIVVRLEVDGRPMVLRRPPEHPRPTSDNTMRREIAVLTTLAGTTVPHPELIAGCDDLDVLGVVFYLMQAVDGFNPGNETDEAYVRDAEMRHDVGLSYAAGLAQLGSVPWQGSALAAIKRPGSFLARQVPQFMRLLESYRHEHYAPESFPAVGVLAEWLEAPASARRRTPGIMHGDAHLNNVLLRQGHTGVGCVHRLGDVHCRRPVARSRLDPGVLARWSEPDQRRRRTGRTRRAGDARRADRGVPRRGRTPRDAAGLVRRDGVLQARHRHRGNLVASPCRAGRVGTRATGCTLQRRT